MNLVNRCAMVIKPKAAYVEWANSAATSYETLEELQTSAKVLLLPSAVYEDSEAFLTQYAQVLFEMELEAWIPDQKFWPSIRNAKNFKEWFEVTFHALVVDFFENGLADLMI